MAVPPKFSTLFRSAAMTRGTIVLPLGPRSKIYIEKLGIGGGQIDGEGKESIQRGCEVHFIDMNEHCLIRPFQKYLQRIEEMERIVRFLEEEVERLKGAEIIRGTNGIEVFLSSQDEGYVLEKVEEALNRLYAQFLKFKANNADLLVQKQSASQEKFVMESALRQLQSGKGGEHLTAAEVTSTSDEEVSKSLLLDKNSFDEKNDAKDEDIEIGRSARRGLAVSTVVAVVRAADIPKFSRMLFRSTRGNAFSFFDAIPDKFKDEVTGQDVEKSVAVVYFQGGQDSLLYEKIQKVCKAFSAQTYKWPSSVKAAEEKITALNAQIQDKEKALNAYESFFLSEVSMLLEVPRPGGSSLLEEWRMFCIKEKAIYATLNKFEGRDLTLRCDCWIPKGEEEVIRGVLKLDADEFEHDEEQGQAFLLTEKEAPTSAPPTLIRTTEFLAPSQSLVDTYGVPRYQELNPAVLTSVTFPFLFGVMFGDIGHGGIIFLFAIYLLIWNRWQKGEENALSFFFQSRYLFFLIGIFSIYGGFMYNDFFSLGVDIFGTRWIRGKEKLHSWLYEQKPDSPHPYPFGVDPQWKGAVNELTMTNSLKMKFSVLVGFVQMLCGVIMKGFNAWFFKEPLEFLFEFIPQTIFLVALVGYMDFLIIFKWVTSVEGNNKPNLINAIIGMCRLETITPQNKMFSSQQITERILVVMLVLSIPLMLFPKPICEGIHMSRNRKKHKSLAASSNKNSRIGDSESNNDLASQIQDDNTKAEHEGTGWADLFIRQTIETIEFVLGTVSNTASYLRLWALSLAHQQIALVFYTQTIVRAVQISDKLAIQIPVIFLAFIVFAVVTCCVVMGMDSMEVALHALRLQWVEFQNKFYKGDGYAFRPFSFYQIIKKKDDGTG